MSDTVCRLCGRPYEPEGGSLIAHALEFGHRFVPSAPKAVEVHDDEAAASDWNEADYDPGWGE